jgi:hypothetical protein
VGGSLISRFPLLYNDCDYNYLRTYVPVSEVYKGSDCFNKLLQEKKKRKEKHEKMSSQLKLDMASGIITADHPFITLCCQEEV